MVLPRSLARFNRRVTNPLMLLFAAAVPPWVVVEHVGRRSGRRYRTPLWAFRHPDGHLVALTYGESTEWLRNLLASSGGLLHRAGREIPLGRPVVLRGQEGLRHLPPPVRLALRVLRVDMVALLPRAAPTARSHDGLT